MMLEQEKIGKDRGIPGWLELYDLSLHPDIEARNPRGAYIRGIISTEKQFAPESEILGKAISKPENIGQNSGWLDLETLQLHSDIQAVAPSLPYVHGQMDEEGHFYPDEPFKIISS